MKPDCPCGSGAPLTRCCGPYLADFAGCPAPDAQALMRSRYTAFVQEDRAYLLATWHPAHRPMQLEFEPGVRWLGLEVRAYRPLDGKQAEVEFVARSRPPAGRAVRLHERSRFTRENGRWYYLDGDML